MDSKPASNLIELEGLNQDEVVRKAEEAAKLQGYNRFSVKNIVKIVYSVELSEPLVEEKPQEEQPVAPEQPVE
jgi:hypothetical protein